MAKVNFGHDISNGSKEREWISRDIYTYFIIIMLSLIILSPMLNTGYISDDSLDSLFRGSVPLAGESLLHHIYSMARNSIIYGGRFRPLVSLYTSTIFILIPSLYLYKMSILFLIITNILLFRYLVQLMTGSKTLSFLCLLFLPLLFQFRFYHDPILSFGGLEQTILLYTFASLICFEFYLRTNRKYLLVASLFFFMLDLLTYEMAYPFFVFHGVLSYSRSRTGNISSVFKKTVPFLLLAIFFALIWASVKLMFPPAKVYEGIKANLIILPFCSTLVKQCYAATPLSYFAADPDKIFLNPFLNLKPYFGIGHFLIAAGYIICFFEFSRRGTDDSNSRSNYFRGPKWFFLFGFLLLVLPSILIALSLKYQKEVAWGLGYITVYISYFGLSIIFALLFYKAFEFLRKSKKNVCMFSVSVGTLCGVVGSINYTNNETVTKHLNHSFLYPRAFIEEGLKNGLLKGVPQESTLIVDGDYDLDVIRRGWNYYRWDKRAFYFMNSGVRLRTMGMKERFLEKDLTSKFTSKNIGGQRFRLEIPDEENLFYLGYHAQNAEEGYAVLGRVLNLFLNEDKVYRITSKDSVFIYVQTPYPYELKRLSLVGHFIYGDSSEPFTLRVNHLNLVRSGVNWRVFSIDPGKPISLKSLRAVFHDEGT
jgi:hypothetical protein